MTLEAWVNPTVVTRKWRDVIYKGHDIYFLEATSRATGGLPAGGVTIGASVGVTYGTAPLVAGAWTHLALTYDNAALRLYVNGAEVSNIARTGALAASTNPLQFGGDSIFGQYYAGLIDEVRIYNRPLSVAEIQADMATPVGSPLMLLGAAVSSVVAPPPPAGNVRPLIDEAVARWALALGDAQTARRLQLIDVQFVDLPSTTLGVTSANAIWIDTDAAGHGWFLDPTPWEDSEFIPGGDLPTADRADLLTVLIHEMGHILGLDDDPTAGPGSGDVMADSLPAGTRRVELGSAAELAHALDAFWTDLGAED
jgi:hypothetical protein